MTKKSNRKQKSRSQREVDETAAAVPSAQGCDAGGLGGLGLVAPDPGSGVAVSVDVVEQLGRAQASPLEVLLHELRHHHRLVQAVVSERMLLCMCERQIDVR